MFKHGDDGTRLIHRCTIDMYSRESLKVVVDDVCPDWIYLAVVLGLVVLTLALMVRRDVLANLRQRSLGINDNRDRPGDYVGCSSASTGATQTVDAPREEL